MLEQDDARAVEFSTLRLLLLGSSPSCSLHTARQWPKRWSALMVQPKRLLLLEPQYVLCCRWIFSFPLPPSLFFSGYFLRLALRFSLLRSPLLGSLAGV